MFWYLQSRVTHRHTRYTKWLPKSRVCLVFKNDTKYYIYPRKRTALCLQITWLSNKSNHIIDYSNRGREGGTFTVFKQACTLHLVMVSVSVPVLPFPSSLSLSSSIPLSADGEDSTVSIQIKLENEGSDEELETDMLYSPQLALKLALTEWLGEFLVPHQYNSKHCNLPIILQYTPVYVFLLPYFILYHLEPW